MRKLILAAVVAGSLATYGTFLATTAHAAGPTGELCQTAGTATFSSPGIPGAPPGGTVGFSFTGNLTGCQGNADASISSGAVTASGTTTGSCANSTASGTGTITWNNGNTTLFSFTVNGAGPSVTVQSTDTGGTETALAGDGGLSELIFQPTSGDCVQTNVTAASFQGVTGIGMLGVAGH